MVVPWKAMVVPWATTQLDREDAQSSVGCSILLGYYARLYGDIGSDRTNVWADGLVAGGGGRRQWATVLSVDARRACALGPQCTCSWRESGASEARSLGGPLRRG